MNLWPHQARGLSELSDAIASGETRICLTSPTGGGKSRMMFDHIQQNEDRRFHINTDRRMLLSQLAGNLSGAGIKNGMVASGYEPSIAKVQLCMVQTVYTRCVKGARSLPSADEVFWDEAHKMGGESMQAIRELVGDHVDIGVTATPLGVGCNYNKLIVAGTNSELRDCGALVPAYHYGPDEPDTKWIGKIAVGEGECGIPQSKRMQFAKRVFGRVVENYLELNPKRTPAILFAPGVAESIWFTSELASRGISAAHIDGEDVVIDGEKMPKTQELVDEIRDRLRRGDIQIVCNRFVLREGIDWPFVQHGILATVFGSLTAYLQAGGRLLRACEGKARCTIQDHGGNWWRHGSLNEDREWSLEYTDRIVSGLREQRIRDRKDPEPIVCPKCNGVRLGGKTCGQCGFEYTKKVRMVVQHDGTLREMKGDIFRQRRVAERTEDLEKSWSSRVAAVRRSKKATVKRMTFMQLATTFARDHNWQYPPRDLPSMPVRELDWFRPVAEVSELTRAVPKQREATLFQKPF